ncbi:hypothetical protein FNO01nite_12360 [Flavobacterium noncentrifugens]|uniref:Delta-60 repeat domain-containing protein/Por secretion system C-terminal sorting domain-containing protein n=1 Tax=Flavobacterium noncentrifugens TaxID=1128970 RepID=A0A1G8VLL9_9FLAO|nr:T9SS type A sorting domain-containing protein [Flavobacterium noncentrifugens]GEP50564.1 hypothetical protein FNO01nite_12360 [Flavobacterium noncentrifugens]SDJ66966.1 delta-60 repeat domain-containing protein/Por secretion system C-terminal sorting domain-containing protein [Flavobacterium noncentrifugens]
MNKKLLISALLLSASAFSQNLIPDLSFGNNGKVQTSFGADNSILSRIAVQPDGKIVACGTYNKEIDTAPYTVNQLALTRYNINGTIDLSFGTNGKIILPIGSDDSNEHNDVKILSNGKILVMTNRTVNAAPNQQNTDYVLLRFNADGTPDGGFGTNGMAVADFDRSDFGRDMELQSDGKIVIAGTSFTYDSNDTDFAVSRYNSDGSKDLIFGVNGIVRINFGTSTNSATRTYEDANALKIQPDGKIIIAGYTSDGMGPERAKFALARLNADGTLDANFGVNGKAYTNFTADDEIAESIQLLPNGKIIACGTMYYNNDDNEKIVVAKYNANGTLDATFANGGKLITETNNQTPENYAFGSHLTGDGKFLIVGGGFNNGILNAFLLQINADGSQDAAFGNNGFYWIDPQEMAAAKDIIITNDGKITLGGVTVTSDGPTGEQFVLWRFIQQTLVQQDFSKTAFTVSPNPFENIVNVDFKMDQEEFLSFELIDQTGRKIQQLFSGHFSIGQNSKQLQMPQLPKGAYFLNISGKQMSKTIKIIK